MDKVHDSRYKATPERVYVIHLEAFDWNCPQHIIPRFSEEEIQEAVAPAEKRMQDLEQENQKLRAEVAHLNNRKRELNRQILQVHGEEEFGDHRAVDAVAKEK
jgi:hypothetical protein